MMNKKMIITAILSMVFSGLFFIVLLLMTISAVIVNQQQSQEAAVGDAIEALVNAALGEEYTTGGGKYRQWYNGTADGAPWCATFVSWCANEAGLLDQNIIPKFESCDYGVNWFNQQDRFIYTERYGGVEYTPEKGDLIFFAWDQNINDSTHVGIVTTSDNGRVYTIEGNTSDMVRQRSYLLSNPQILGYARPDYASSTGNSDFTGSSNAEIIWNFFRSKGCNEYAAAGIMGNLQQESGLNPNAQQSGGGPGRGLAQWTVDSNRWYNLLNKAESMGMEWTALEVQLEFIWWEFTGGESTTKKLLDSRYGGVDGFRNSPSLEWSTEVFERCYERAGKPNMERRINYARAFYERFAGN